MFQKVKDNPRPLIILAALVSLILTSLPACKTFYDKPEKNIFYAVGVCHLHGGVGALALNQETKTTSVTCVDGTSFSLDYVRQDE